MTKLCSVCATENRDEAQFCRSCGTTLPSANAVPADQADALAAGIVCAECAFQNKPGVRFCANCGVSLLAGAAAPPAPSPDDPFSGLSASPPPLSYPSFAPVAPYPPAPAPIDLQDWAGAPATDSEVAALGHDGYPPDDAYPPHSGVDLPADVPDADLAAAPREQQVFSAANAPAAGAPNRGPLVVVAIATVLVLAGAAGWWYMSGSSSPPPTPASVAMPPPTALPTPTVPPPLPVEAASASVATPGLASSMPLSTVAPGEVIVAPGNVASSPAPAALETPAVPPSSEADNEVKRLAAEKIRREKLAREKTERDAKAKSNEQRDQAAAAAARAATARAEQEALTRRRAEEALRQRNLSVTPNPAATAQPQVRGVKEICAGRGTIAEAICHSRECGASEHANEAICRQVREAEERRRNYTN